MLAVPNAVGAQSVRKLHRVGIFTIGGTIADLSGPQPRDSYAGALVRGLNELGYVYGDQFTTVVRSADGSARRAH